jgi:hypothetical protein
MLQEAAMVETIPFVDSLAELTLSSNCISLSTGMELFLIGKTQRRLYYLPSTVLIGHLPCVGRQPTCF